MVEVIQEVRELSANFLQSQDDDGHTYDAFRRGQCDNHPLAQAMQAAFNAGRASVIQWLRDDAHMTEIEARRILGSLVKLTPADTDDWAKLILMKHGIAEALEKLP